MRIRGVEMWMSDATSKLIGSRSGSTEVFELAIGENVKKLNVQASGETSSGGYYRLGAIYLETDRGRSFGIYSDNLKEDGCYWPSVGSGLVCGMFGSGGDDVDNLGFALLQPVKQARLVDVTYPNLDMEVVANTPETVASEYYTNETSVDQSYTLTGKKTVTTKREWSTSTAFESSIETSVTGRCPDGGICWCNRIMDGRYHHRAEQICDGNRGTRLVLANHMSGTDQSSRNRYHVFR